MRSAKSTNPGHEKWDNLAQWLRYGSGCYWTCGKAGFRELSPMKYIQSYIEILILLHEWARGSPLILNVFYFYHSGSNLQKSQ